MFDAEAEAAASSIASTAAVAIANARLLQSARREAAAREVALRQRDQVAVALQQSLLPPDLPAIPGLELGAHYHAGTELVGGDFYDVFALGEDTWGIVLGDVCGSGPEAASQTALTRHTVRTAAMFDTDPATVLQTLNRALLRSNTDALHHGGVPAPDARDADRGEVAISIASAGHPPALICRRDGTVEESSATRPAARRDRFRRRRRCRSRDYELRPGDMLVLYTDGLTEARTRRRPLRRRRRQGDADAAARTRRRRDLANALVDAALAARRRSARATTSRS